MAKPHRLPKPGEAADPDFIARLHQIERLAVLYDCRFRIPLTRIRFGFDPIVGIVPVAGDLIMAVANARLIVQSRSLGLSGAGTARMALNVLIDLLLGSVPIAGPIMDVFFRSNLRNLDLLLREFERSRGTPPG